MYCQVLYEIGPQCKRKLLNVGLEHAFIIVSFRLSARCADVGDALLARQARGRPGELMF